MFQDMSGKVVIIDDHGVRTPMHAPAVSGDVDNVFTLVDTDFNPDEYILNHSNHHILSISSPRSECGLCDGAMVARRTCCIVRVFHLVA